MGEPDEAEPATYAEASAELEQILEELERGSPDVDLLTARVQRASALLQWCRQRLDATELAVEQVVADLPPRDERDPGAA